MKILIFFITIMFGLGALMSQLNKNARTNLQNINNTNERIEYRKQIYKKRKKLIRYLIYYPFIALVFAWSIIASHFIASVDNPQIDWKMWGGMFMFTFATILMVAVPLGIMLFLQYKGNLSYLDKTTFLESGSSFILYLRGFENDNYSDRFQQSLDNRKIFSEYKFTKAISNNNICVAIGMTKELDAPLGAKRIYVDDTTWKEDVKDLIDKAETVFILMNDRPSCIWEVENSAQYIDKTVYIIDNPVKYVLVQEAVKYVIPFPHIPALSMENKFFYLLHVNGKFMSFEYTNTKKGYRKLLENVFERRKSLCRTTC